MKSPDIKNTLRDEEAQALNWREWAAPAIAGAIRGADTSWRC
jgi:hypothetical protein